MLRIKLQPKSRHGQNRIDQHGSEWIVEKEDSTTFFLRSLNKTWRNHKGEMEHDKRQVLKVDDPDFKIQ